MSDLFKDKAQDWDQMPIPQQISLGVGQAMKQAVDLHSDMEVIDFGAGTGLICAQIAQEVKKVYAVDISESMLAKLAEKEELKGRVDTICQDLTQNPLAQRADLIVSAMAMHHVEDSEQLFNSFYQHLKSNGKIAIADLDQEDGDFHPPHIEGVYHAGFNREHLTDLAEKAGFSKIKFQTAITVTKENKDYPIFLLTAQKPV